MASLTLQFPTLLIFQGAIEESASLLLSPHSLRSLPVIHLKESVLPEHICALMQLILFSRSAIRGEFSELKTTTNTPQRVASHLTAMELPFILAHLCLCVCVTLSLSLVALLPAHGCGQRSSASDCITWTYVCDELLANMYLYTAIGRTSIPSQVVTSNKSSTCQFPNEF